MAIWDKLGQKLGQIVDDLTVPEPVQRDLDKGIAALQRGDLDTARSLLRRVTGAEPDHGKAHYLLGLTALAQSQTDEAIRSLRRARELRPGDIPTLMDLAGALRLAGDLPAALDCYKEALRGRASDEELARIYRFTGEIYLLRGEWEHAVRELRKASALKGHDDLQLAGLLGQAQLRAGDRSQALHHLSRAAAATPPEREVLLLLARLLLEQGQPDEARLAMLRLLEASTKDAEARCLLGRCLLAAGDREGARTSLLEALQDQPRNAEALRILGEVHLSAGDPLTALTHLRSALALLRSPHAGGEVQPAEELVLLRQVLLLQLELSEIPFEELERDARRLLEARPDDPLALACLGVVAQAQGQVQQAMVLLSRSLAGQETHAGRLGLGLLLLRTGQPAQAAVTLRAALRLDPRSRRSRELLAQALHAQAGLSGPPAAGPTGQGADFYPVLQRIHKLFLSHPALSPLSPEVARIREVFDRPLLVTVMGEFNSGKSTLVNAFIGEKIAPMGVTPTTATINVLKYGERRAARVVYRDDREELLQWSEVGSYLGGLDARQARAIRHVELLYPAEELLRVNMVDTPGLNSLIEEHEQTAREILGQADAVIWLFCAQQAGKQTEEDALEILRQHRLKTVGVVNKVDGLTDEELSAIMGHLQQGFADLVEAVFPVSARQALEALVAGDAQGLDRSRFSELRRFLEQHIFARSRQIKRESSGKRLGEVAAQARLRLQALLVHIDQAQDHLLDLKQRVGESLQEQPILSEERRRLKAALSDVYRRGAREVLDFVRPRRWALGEHRASAADRDFLLDLLTGGLHKLGETSYDRMAGRLHLLQQQIIEGLGSAEVDTDGLALLRAGQSAAGQLVGERLALLREQVYTRYITFVRGFLRGGRVDHFFTHKLPRLDLTEEAIFEALEADRADLEEELLQPLSRWISEAREALLRQLAGLEQEVDLARLELSERYLEPLLFTLPAPP